MYWFTNPYSPSNFGSVQHEVIHALGFTAGLFNSWWNATSNSSQVGVSANVTVRGDITQAITQPAVLAAA